MEGGRRSAAVRGDEWRARQVTNPDGRTSQGAKAILTTLLSFIFVLGVLVFVHELGHFLVGKKAGIKVEQFSLGYPPKAIGVTWGETEYLISWLPLGGYVKFAGMSDFSRERPEGQPWEFQSKPRWVQMAVLAAGPAMNFALGYALILSVRLVVGDFAYLNSSVVGGVEASSALSAAGVQPGDRITAIAGTLVTDWEGLEDGLQDNLDRRVAITAERAGETVRVEARLEPELEDIGLHPFISAVVGQVVPGYPAQAAGIHTGDRIVSVDGTPVRTWWEMSVLISSRPGVPVAVEWLRDGETMSATITPKGDEVGGRTVGRIGIGWQVELQPVGFVRAVTRSGEQLLAFTTTIYGFIHRIVVGEGSGRDLAGPVAIAQMAGENARAGFEQLFSFMALLSVNLAVLNLLPIPMLDGGHLFILLVEAVTRRDLTVRQKEFLQRAGFAFLLLLMVYVTVNDLGRVFGWFG